MRCILQNASRKAVVILGISTMSFIKTNAFSILPSPIFSNPRAGIFFPWKHQIPILASTTEDKKTEIEVEPLGKPGTAKMDVPWGELGFSFRPVKSHLRLTYKEGAWGEPELVEVSFFFNIIAQKS